MKERTYTLPVLYDVINSRAYATWGVRRARVIVLNIIVMYIIKENIKISRRGKFVN